MNWLFLNDYPKYREILEINGKKGSLEVTFPPPYLKNITARIKLYNSKGVSKKSGGIKSAFKIEVEEFYKKGQKIVSYCNTSKSTAADPPPPSKQQ